ncbi:hypothetical protein K470DRAFT_270742 [Piedraia hortae CBS 480.64]|uniref:Uncharacterized protein n=1 Tax=Piedraia hortae CBS 480.64 TaxID=1314780 RepID=A0A6A7BYB8_9PEZI|nr:hypothetical protein K470DRAFT_270742 [Piedraia hortae CBS 480.64]
MHILKTLLSLLFLSLVSAGPVLPLETDDWDFSVNGSWSNMTERAKRPTRYIPTIIENMDEELVQCGNTPITKEAIRAAIEWGSALNENHDGRETDVKGKSTKWPKGYGNSEKFVWINEIKECNGYRLEFPVIEGRLFGDTPDGKDSPGLYRAIFTHKRGKKNRKDGQLVSYYCGTIYHIGRAGEFAGCDVSNNA